MKCKNWKILELNQDLDGLLGCCFRTQLLFVGETKRPDKFFYGILRKVMSNYMIEESEECNPISESKTYPFDRTQLWEYCCDYKIEANAVRDHD